MNRDKAIQEIGYIYHLRNIIGHERDRLRHKLRYLQQIKNSMQVRDNFEASHYYKRLHNVAASQIPSLDEAKSKRKEYLKNYPIPKKFKDISLSELNFLILEAERKVLDLKIKTMKHTKKYANRLDFLRKMVRFLPHYSCGIVKRISVAKEETFKNFSYLEIYDLKKLHDNFLAEKAIDKMLKG